MLLRVFFPQMFCVSPRYFEFLQAKYAKFHVVAEPNPKKLRVNAKALTYFPSLIFIFSPPSPYHIISCLS